MEERRETTILDDGFELVLMDKILRDNKGVSLIQRFMIWYFMATWATYLPFYPTRSRERVSAWRACLKGDNSLIENELSMYMLGDKVIREMAKKEFADPMFRVRIAIYVIVTVGLVYGMIKLFVP